MNPNDRLVRPQFPRSAAYHPEWIVAPGMGGNALWLAEWYRPGAAIDVRSHRRENRRW